MSMVLEKNQNRIKVIIPNSEATISAQLKCIKDSEVTGYYMNDKEEIKNEFVKFLAEEYDYILNVPATINVIKTIKDNYYDYKEIFKDNFSSLDSSFSFFQNANNEYLRIPRMFYSGQNNRYYKFDNSDPAVKKLREILYGDITGFYISKDNNYYKITPFLVDNVKEILEKRKVKILNNNEIQYWTYSPGENGTVWDYCFNNNKMLLGWDAIGDYSKYANKEDIANAIKEAYGQENPFNSIAAVSSFCYDLKPNDIVIAKVGQTKLLGYGQVIDNEYYFDDSIEHYKNVRNVKWLKRGEWPLSKEDQVAQKTLTNITEYKDFVKRLMNIMNGGEKMKEKFREWLSKNGFAESSVNMYTSSISLTSNEAIEDGILDKSIYEISDIEELDKVVAILNTNERFNARKINSNNINTASISNYRRFLDEYNIVDEKDNNVEWLLPANGEVYNHKESFEKNGCIDWRQTRNFAVNDIIYIYSTSPEKRISALTKVEKINILPNETIDDREFWNTNEKYNEDKDRYCRLRLINFIDNDKLSLDNLMKHGLNAAPQGAIKLTEELSSYIHSILDEDRSYSRDKFLNEVYIDGKLYDSMISILEKKKNIILEGAPGVGKTFMAKRLAYSIIRTKDEDKLCLIQFHQSYSYEDFIEGYRPTENGFELEHGIFYKFCKKAENDPNHDYYMIIDEINRGNLSKIFGELLMLIESDKRGEKLQLAYSEEEFSVPDNLYIIGLMNTADRSLALIDYALRRRFSFVRIEPAFDNDNFIRDFNNKFDADYSNIIKIIKDINEAIENDKSLGSGFKIGHSYFCPDIKDRKGNKKDLIDIITYEIKPLLEEYWYDDEDAIIQWESALDGVIDD